MGLAEKSHFVQNLRKSRILFKTCAFTSGKVAFCSKLAQKSDFVQNLRNYLRKSRILFKSLSKMRQRAASNGAITCGKVAFCSNLYQKCDKGPQVMRHSLAEKSHFEQIFIKNATKGYK